MSSKVTSPVFLLTFFSCIIVFYAGNLIYYINVGDENVVKGGFLYLERWKIGQYYFSYFDLGFSRRSLIGTIYDYFGVNDSTDYIIYISCAAVILSAFIISLYIESYDITGKSVIIFSPALFMQMGYDFGRLDVFNTLILLIFMIINSRYCIYIMLICLFIHEASLFTHIPAAIFFYISRYGLDGNIKIFSISVLIVSFLVYYMHNDPSIDDIVSKNPLIDPSSVGVLDQGIRDMVYASIFRTLGMGVLEFLLIVVASIYAFILLYHIFREADAGYYAVLFLAPFALCAIALDYPRWIALAAASMLLVIMLNGYSGIPRRKILLAFSLLGPMGIFFPFPAVLEILADAV